MPPRIRTTCYRVAPLIAALALAIIHSGCRRVETRVPSPDGQYVVTVYRSDSGALGGDTFVDLARRGLAIPQLSGETILFLGGWYELDIVWTDDSTLSVKCPTCPSDDTFRRLEHWRDVTIVYPQFGEATRKTRGLGAAKPAKSAG